MNTELLLMLIKKDQGKHLASINPWKYPQQEPWRQKFFYDMWVAAFQNNSSCAFHTLSLYTPDEFLETAIELATEEHSSHALTPLFGKKYTFEVRKKMVEKLHPCSLGITCTRCHTVKKNLMHSLS
jgi:hypothetical protein